MNPLPRVRIVSPALAGANNGNWRTAARWQRLLARHARVDIATDWHGEPLDALIALHARRSAEAVARFRAAHPEAPLALVLTGTDLYRDIEIDPLARHSLQCASHLIVLQPAALERLDPALRAQARVILQSAPRLLRDDGARRTVDFVAVGHLRDEKDPLTLLRAVARLPAASSIRVLHIGGGLDPALAAAAERAAAVRPGYRWLGALPQPAARRWIARARALVHPSRMEGGANVVVEALRSRVPVLASRIDGNLGLLGPHYEGYFPVGDDAALAALMQRFAADAGFAAALKAQCLQVEARFAPEAEAAALQELLDDLVGPPKRID